MATENGSVPGNRGRAFALPNSVSFMVALLLIVMSQATSAQALPITLTGVSPLQVTIGAGPTTLMLTGTGFSAGMTIAASSQFVQVLSVTALSATSGTALIDTLPGAQPGSVRFDLYSPSGANTTGQIPPPPSIALQTAATFHLTDLSPRTAIIGAGVTQLTFSGAGFQQGMVLQPADPQVQVLGVTVLSPSLATAFINIPPTVNPGPMRLDLFLSRNVSTLNQIPPPPPLIFVPPGGIAAPLAVRELAIVHPLPGTLFAPESPIFARGVVATSGSGTLIGLFLLDGVAYDQFAVFVGGGQPVTVEAKLPIPFTSGGGHDLQIQILSPQTFYSGAVRLVGVAETRTSLQLISPLEGDSASAPAPFRWTLVPGASGYEVLLGRQPFDASARVWRTPVNHWVPTQDDWASLGSGTFYWSVRAVYPGEARGTAAPFRRVSLLSGPVVLSVGPPSLGPRPGSARLSWSGAPQGALFFLEFFAAGGDQRLFTAYTREPNYLLRFPPGAGDLDYAVTAFDAGGTRLGESARGRVAAPRSAVWSPDASVSLAAGPVAVTGTSPKEGATVPSAQPSIGATWSGSVSPDEVILFVGSSDVTAMASIQPGRITYTPVLPLPEGPNSVSLTLGDAMQKWSFTVRGAASSTAPTEPSAAGAGSSGGSASKAAGGAGDSKEKPTGSWTTQLGLVGTQISGSRPDQQDTARLTGSLQTDLGRGGGFFKTTSDASIRHDFMNPSRTVNESRNWLFDTGFKNGKWGGEALVGYGAVDILGDSQLVSSGLARGGVEGKLSTPGGQFGLYASFDNTTPSLGSASGASSMRVRAASYALPLPSEKYSVRFMGLWTRQGASAYLAGGDNRVFGILGKFTFSPQISLLIEAAQGQTLPHGGSSSRGMAYRVGFAGTMLGTTYSLNLRRAASNFSNPANPGYTQGGVPDRTGADLSLSRSFGKLCTAFGYRYARDGVGPSLAGAASATQHAATLTFALPVGTATSFNLALNDERDRGGQNALYSLPGTERSIFGLTFGSTQRAGNLFFSETYSGQRVKDGLNPTAKMNTDTFVATMGGSLTRSIGIAATTSFTRAKGAALTGTTDLWVASLSPYWNIERFHLNVMPRAMYSRTKNNLGTVDTRMEQYGVTLQWNPTWLRSLMAFQGTAEWNSNRSGVGLYPSPGPLPPGGGGYPPPGLSDHRYLLNVSFRWGGGRGTLDSRYAQPGGVNGFGAGVAPSPIPPSGYTSGGMGL